MQIDLYPIIKPLLSKYQFLFIPGLGTFTEKHVPAKVDTLNGKLLPPETIVTFEQGTNGDGRILHTEIKNRFSVDDEIASEAIRLFSRQIHNELDLHNSTELPPLGRLYFNIDHKIAFVPRLKVFENDSFGLPEISLPAHTQIINSISMESDKPQIPPPLPPVPPNPILKFILFSLLVVSLSIGAFFLVSSAYFKENWTLIKEMVAAWKIENKESEPIKNTAEVVSDTLSNVDDFPPQEEDEILESPKPEKKEMNEKGEIVKIAIGVFGNPENAARMVNKIEKAGYSSFSEKAGTLTKVGVEQKYNTLAEKLEILEKVRLDIEKTAVIIN